MAEEFLQAATQAPHPIHAEERNASSAFSFSIVIEFASGASPVLAETYPPEEINLTKAFQSTDRSLITGNDSALNGSKRMLSSLLNALICNWQTVVAFCGP